MWAFKCKCGIISLPLGFNNTVPTDKFPIMTCTACGKYVTVSKVPDGEIMEFLL